MANCKKCGKPTSNPKYPLCSACFAVAGAAAKPPTVLFMVSRPEAQADGSFHVHSYAIVRLSDGTLVPDGQEVVFHADDLDEEVKVTTSAAGRADYVFIIPAKRAGESVDLTVYAQVGGMRCEATKPVAIPPKAEAPKLKTVPIYRCPNCSSSWGGKVCKSCKFPQDRKI